MEEEGDEQGVAVGALDDERAARALGEDFVAEIGKGVVLRGVPPAAQERCIQSVAANGAVSPPVAGCSGSHSKATSAAGRKRNPAQNKARR